MNNRNDEPIWDWNVAYANWDFASEDNNEREIRKNSRVLAQAYRTETGFFAKLPLEGLVKIASLTGMKNNPTVSEEKEAINIAYVNFDRPNCG
jgi:hypothetical protein